MLLLCLLITLLLVASLKVDNLTPSPDVPTEPDIIYDETVGDVNSEAYCLRDDYLIYAQHQDKNGLCWCFASSMAASTTLMKATGEYYDFSEAWTALTCNVVTHNCATVGAGGSISYHRNSMQSCGMMLEGDLPYQNTYLMSQDSAVDYYNYYAKYANDDVSGMLVYDESTKYSKDDIQGIKEHIIEHGSLYMGFTFRTGFVEENGVFSLEPNQKQTNSNHAISIIGWDDNYEKTFYLDGSDTPTVFKGAWIVLNSYTETNSKDGIALIFYEDNNIYQIEGYRYEKDTSKSLYFYDSIEEGYAYPTFVKGKYYGDLTATAARTKQKNIFYDNVDLAYTYEVSEGARIEGIEIYLNQRDVTHQFEVTIDEAKKKFYISAPNPAYGQYKVLVRYGNGEESDTYLNNFFVTHGLVGEELEFANEQNQFVLQTGRELEYYSYTTAEKNYVIYTTQTEGVLSFVRRGYTSIYSEQNMDIPDIAYQITDGKSCTVTHTITAKSGYQLHYNFTFVYCPDTAIEQVRVYYDLGGGINHNENYDKELASETTPLVLYEPTRPGYTFAGWYMDYGHGSVEIPGQNGEYHISWDDIIHLGEDPKLYASGHYKAYYYPSNVLFVYARWNEIDYHDVNINITGKGTVQLSEDFSLGQSDGVTCLFAAERGWCLSEVKVNGIALTIDKLLAVIKGGLVLENTSQDTTLDVTFAQGVLLAINFGENIKDAYLTKSYQGETIRFYDGQFIPANYFDDDHVFMLVVEVADAKEGMTYQIADFLSYTPLSREVFTKEVRISYSAQYKEVDVGSAKAKPIEEVEVSYTVSEEIIDHYLSWDKNATSGSQFSGFFRAGDIIYLFVKPKMTITPSPTLSSEYEPLSDGWYRRAIYVSADAEPINVRLGFSIPIDPPFIRTYTITWENWDGRVLCTQKYRLGATPSYPNSSPSRPGEDGFIYIFIGWDPVLSPVRSNQTYRAVFMAVPDDGTTPIPPVVPLPPVDQLPPMTDWPQIDDLPNIDQYPIDSLLPADRLFPVDQWLPINPPLWDEDDIFIPDEDEPEKEAEMQRAEDWLERIRQGN